MNSPIPEVQALFAVMGGFSITIATIAFCLSGLAIYLSWLRAKMLKKILEQFSRDQDEVASAMKKFRSDWIRNSREKQVVIDALVAELGYDPQNTANMAISHTVIFGVRTLVAPIALPSVLTMAKGVGLENTLKARVDEVRLEVIGTGGSDGESGPDTG